MPARHCQRRYARKEARWIRELCHSAAWDAAEVTGVPGFWAVLFARCLSSEMRRGRIRRFLALHWLDGQPRVQFRRVSYFVEKNEGQGSSSSYRGAVVVHVR